MSETTPATSSDELRGIVRLASDKRVVAVLSGVTLARVTETEVRWRQAYAPRVVTFTWTLMAPLRRTDWA